jgi:tetratricopeptide (TPR) repeat protein
MLTLWFPGAVLHADFDEEPLYAADLADIDLGLRAHQGDVDTAVAHFRASADLARDQGDIMRFVLQYLRIGDLLHSAGDLNGALLAHNARIESLEPTDESSNLSTVHAQRSLVLALLGDEVEARNALATSRALQNPRDLLNAILYATIEGLLAARAGNSSESDQHFAEASRLLATTDFVPQLGELHLTKSLAREVLNDPDGALASAREALVVAERKGFVPPITRALVRVQACEKSAAGT